MATTKLTPLQHNVKLIHTDTSEGGEPGTPTPYMIQLLQQLLEEKAVTDELADDAVQPADLTAALLALEFDDLADVDMTTTPPADGEVPTWDDTNEIWVPGAGGGGGGGALMPVSQTILGAAAASVDILNIPSDGEDLILVINARGTQAATSIDVRLRFNNDSGANYDYESTQSSGATEQAFAGRAIASGYIGNIGANTAPANSSDSIVVEVPNYKRTTFQKAASFKAGLKKAVAADTDLFEETGSLWWRSTAAINRITVFPSAGNFAIGTVVTLYKRTYTVPAAIPPVWTTLVAWDFAVNGAVAELLSGDLTPYSELLIMGQAVTLSVAGWRVARFSVDGGATYDNTAGNYLDLAPDGTLNNSDNQLFMHSTSSAAARYFACQVYNLRDENKPKLWFTGRTGSTGHGLYLNNNDVTNVRLLPSAGGNFSGGKIWILAR